ncbi:MAG TPA: hypothetical protein VGI40_16135 [Pirellulaceae bacterium]|jgi:hypothetical protein
MTDSKSAPNEFWLNLHRLAEAYAAEGLNAEERIENILAEFREMPHVARRSILEDFRQLASNFPDLFALSVVADRESDGLKKNGPNQNVA